VSIDCTVYVRGRGSVSASFAEAYQASQEPGNLAWIALVEPAEEDFGVIARSFGLEPQFLEEAVRFPHRSDIEKHEDRLLAVLPILRTSGEEADTRGNSGSRSMNKDWVLALAVGEPNMIVTFTDADPAVLDKLRRRMEVKLNLTAEDARAVLFEIVSGVIGDYEDAVEAIDRCIWDAEVTVMEGRSGDVLRQIHNFTSQAVGLQQAVKPLASALEQLSDSDAPLTHRRPTRIRHRALRVTERLDSARTPLEPPRGEPHPGGTENLRVGRHPHRPVPDSGRVRNELHQRVVDDSRSWLRGDDRFHAAGIWSPLPLVQTVGVVVV
jgi:Mg2+ and Co2+ transporter CorA